MNAIHGPCFDIDLNKSVRLHLLILGNFNFDWVFDYEGITVIFLSVKLILQLCLKAKTFVF